MCSSEGSKSHWTEECNKRNLIRTVLGLILFVIFVNDLPRDVLSDVFMFADDTKILKQLSKQTDREIIQSDLDKLFDWSQTWLLRFHPDKCKVLPVSNKSITADTVEYSMKTYDGGRTTLETVDSEKDVRGTIDGNFSFGNLIHNQVNKANQIVGLTRRSFIYPDDCIFCLLFKALVRPHLEYGHSV